MRSLIAFLVLSCCLRAEASSPNVIIILADDMGYGDPACYNSESKIETPNLDRIARKGIRFTDAHTPSSVCTPTRYTLLTGRYCWRTRLKSGVLDGFSPPLIESHQETIASFLREKGYATACIGKWHLGMQWTRKDGSLENRDRWDKRGFRPGEDIDFSKAITQGPLSVGFDSFFGISASLDMPPYCWIENDRCQPLPDTSVPTNHDTIFLNQTGGVGHPSFAVEAVLPELKNRAMRWLKEHRQTHPDQPFFLYLPLNSPHLPVAASKAFAGKSKVGHYGDFVMETDDLVGGLLNTLAENGQEENTIVLFTSDNGGLFHQWEAKEADDLKHYRPTPRGRYTMEFGHQSNAYLRGTKADIWEGGHRVPFLIQWPAKVKGNRVSQVPVELTDVFATLFDIVESEAPSDSKVAPDSFSFKSVLVDERAATGTVRPYLIHHSLRGVFAIRKGDWKYIESRGSGGFSQPRRIPSGSPDSQLYHLGRDPSETKNLANDERQVAEELASLLKKVKHSEK